MISAEEALTIARQAFPEGPEKLAQHLGVEVRRSVLEGCDGWCVRGRQRTIIHISENSSPSRQRFTLAHELSHLILGINSVIAVTLNGMLSSDSVEERLANELASELLLPEDEVKEVITSIPIIPRDLTRLAKHANISEIAAAIRVASIARQLGLDQAVAFYFLRGEFKGHWPNERIISVAEALSLLAHVQSSKANVYSRSVDSDSSLIAISVENSFYEATSLLVQFIATTKLPIGNPEERRIDLEEFMFKGDESFRNKLQGCFGAFKNWIKKNGDSQLEDDLTELFLQRYGGRFEGAMSKKLMSELGREYIKFRLRTL